MRLFEVVLILLTLLLLNSIALVMVSNTTTVNVEKQIIVNDNSEGEMKYVVNSGSEDKIYSPTSRTSERYDKKYFEYLLEIEESREKTFNRGRAYLNEK